MNSAPDDAALPASGCPIRRSPVQSPLSGSPELFAASHVLHRLLAPRHPPYALSSLTTKRLYYQERISQIRYPYAIVKEQPTNPLVRWIHDACNRGKHRASRTSTVSGADRDRTDDLRLARAALSQLSYSPTYHACKSVAEVGLGRVELPTSPLSGVRSSQLSYRPDSSPVSQNWGAENPQGSRAHRVIRTSKGRTRQAAFSHQCEND